MFNEKKTYQVKDRSNARDAALVLLLEICENGRKSSSVMREYFDASDREGGGLSRADKAFVKRLVTGVLDRMITIDTVINRFSSKNVKKLKPVIRAVLRLSVYQILYMDRVPDSAACNEGVSLTRMHGLDALSGFVNGVLRAIAQDAEVSGDRTCAFENDWEKYSVPRWLAKKLEKDFSADEYRRILESFLTDRRDTVRFNLSKAEEADIRSALEKEGFELERIDYARLLREEGQPLPAGRLPVSYMISGGDIASSETFKKGLVTVQDASSALLASYACFSASDYIIDVCAAPGGKSLAAADLTGGRAHIEARDLSRAKCELIESNVRRCGFPNIKIRVMDALKEDEDSFYRADAVIADLPCSGLGVIAKKPDIKYNLETYSFNELRELQRDILRNVSRFIRPKGKLIYSTCTITHEENEENAAFIEAELGMKPVVSCRLLPAADHDGFFIAVFEKKY